VSTSEFTRLSAALQRRAKAERKARKKAQRRNRKLADLRAIMSAEDFARVVRIGRESRDAHR
jgi:hypothetical protein